MKVLFLLILLASCTPSTAIFNIIGAVVNTAANAVGAVVGTAAHAAGAVVGTAANILNTGVHVVAGTANTVVNTAANILGTGVNTIVNAGGAIVSTVLDPFGLWKPDTDFDHGHSTGTVVPCPAVADVIFVLDASGSVGASNFATLLQFAKRLTEHFRIGPSDVQFGAIVFSSQAQKRFDLTTYRDHVYLGQAIASIPYSAGGTKTYLALDLISNEGLLTTAMGARASSSKIVIVVTDGASDNSYQTKRASQTLISSGFQVIAVGIGLANTFELKSIAGGNTNNVFTSFGFNRLFEIEQRLARRTCDIPTQAGFVPKPIPAPIVPKTPPVPVQCISGFTNDPANPQRCVDIDECRFNPCEHYCTNTLGGYVCTCAKGFTVSEFNALRCQEVKACAAVADIILVIDSSGSIGASNYKVQLDFTANLAGHFQVSGQGVRFGAILFSTNVQRLFNLNTYTTSEDIGNALRQASYLEGVTYTNKALDYIVQGGLFSSNVGGRNHAQKIVIVLTDGASTDPQLTQQSGNNLKSKGAILIALGIGPNVNRPELSSLASSPQDVIYVDSFNMLSTVEERLAERTCGNDRGKK